MAILSVDPVELARLIRERRRCGGDRYDEVWDGVYVMSPLADNEHQELAIDLAAAMKLGLSQQLGPRIFAGCNVSSRKQRWNKDYRCPDVAVFLPGNPAEDCGTHWYGGPDFAVEILSPFDRSREKFDFFAKVGVRELLLVARRPWSLEVYRRADRVWKPVGTSDPGPDSVVLKSTVLPLEFRILPGPNRPRIELTQTETAARWFA
jgi:Uma2 family endonuclease